MITYIPWNIIYLSILYIYVGINKCVLIQGVIYLQKDMTGQWKLGIYIRKNITFPWI